MLRSLACLQLSAFKLKANESSVRNPEILGGFVLDALCGTTTKIPIISGFGTVRSPEIPDILVVSCHIKFLGNSVFRTTTCAAAAEVRKQQQR